jgi:hypothetical protein
MTSARKALLAKIKALLAKTVENGCTEAEAIAALEKASALMAEHEVTNADLDFGDEQVTRAARTVDDRDRIRENLCQAVAAFAQCQTWFGTWHEEINFCGLEGDVIFADWLLDTLADFVRRELAAYLARTLIPGMPRVRRRESEAFVVGCCDRISARLRFLAVRPTGTGLVLAKSALIEKKLAELGIHLARGRSRFRLLDGAAHRAGEISGDQARFDRPLEQKIAAAQIGRAQ